MRTSSNLKVGTGRVLFARVTRLAALRRVRRRILNLLPHLRPQPERILEHLLRVRRECMGDIRGVRRRGCVRVRHRWTPRGEGGSRYLSSPGVQRAIAGDKSCHPSTRLGAYLMFAGARPDASAP